MTLQKIFIGGWFQRTTLHLTEIWDFLKSEKTSLDISQAQITEAKASLFITGLTRENGLLEYIVAKTADNIEFRIYEDGLIVLEKDCVLLEKDLEIIKDYYDNKLSKALSLIFSKGAPVPKELADIKTILPYIITSNNATEGEIKDLFSNYSEDIYSNISTKNIAVYRSPKFIVINNLKDESLTREIVESQIFFREFKSQLHRYLEIHRSLWEKIKKIKEQGQIKGTDIDSLRNQLSIYQKTITLIGARIDQMPSYVKTRQKITNFEKIDSSLQPLFQLKFETLLDTHEYIKHLWKMTHDYLASTIEMFTELQAKSTKNTISSLQLITTIGVVSGIIGYLSKNDFPSLTFVGLIYFILLMFLTWIINSVVSKFYKNLKYDIDSREIEKNIK